MKNLDIPSIDINASLKIEELPQKSDPLPPQEKFGQLLFALGTLLSLIIISGVVVLGYFYFKSPEKPTVVTALPTPTTVTKPTEIAIVKNEAIVVEVLNSTGVAGLAGKYKKQLDNQGYKSVTTGNEKIKQTGLLISFSSQLLPQKDALMSSLLKIFPSAKYQADLNSDSPIIRLVIGL